MTTNDEISESHYHNSPMYQAWGTELVGSYFAKARPGAHRILATCSACLPAGLPKLS